MAIRKTQLPYSSRNFVDARQSLIDYIKLNYGADFRGFFEDASVGNLLLELNAAIADNLSFSIDRAFNETLIDHAQMRSSLLGMARTAGIKIRGKKPSVTILELCVTVPVKGDSPDYSYAPKIIKGGSFLGGNNSSIFELQNDVDFSSSFSYSGVPNRDVTANIDSNGIIQSYKICKQEIAVNGRSRLYKHVISQQDAVPFFTIILPDSDIMSIERIIQLNGINYTREPLLEEWLDSESQYYEVDALAQDCVFIDNPTTNDRIEGKWTKAPKRFITEYTDKGFLKITFGSGNFDNGLTFNNNELNKLITQDLYPLGEIPAPNTTLFIKYRVGGGKSTNVGVNTVNTVSNVDIYVNGSNETTNQLVKNSLIVTNPIPALGAVDAPTTEEIRHIIKYNTLSSNRAVTLDDYKSIIYTMNGRYGVPYKVATNSSNGKIYIAILGQNADGTVTNESTNLLKLNLSNYLEKYKMINDCIIIQDAKIVNIAIEVDILGSSNINNNDVITKIRNRIYEFFINTSRDIGQDLFLSQISGVLNDVNSVYSVSAIRVYNRVGGQYSLNETSISYLDEETRQIDISDSYILCSEWNEFFEIKYPNRDITVNIRSSF